MTGRAERAARRGRAPARCATLATLALVALLLASSSALAAPKGPAIAIQAVGPDSGRSYFIYRARPGQHVRGQVSVRNLGDRAARVRLYAVDALTGQTSGAVYRARTDRRSDVGAWTTPATDQLRLAAGQRSTIYFDLRIPADATAGEHLGGLVAENVAVRRGRQQRRGRGRFRIDVRTLAVTAVQVNLPGKRIATMAIGDVKAGGSSGGNQALLVGLANEGNLLLKPSLRMTVRNARQQTVQHTNTRLDTFLPRDRIDYPVAVRRRALPAGRYTANILLDDHHGHLVRARRSFEISNKQISQVFGGGSGLTRNQGSSSLTGYLPWLIAAAISALLGLTLHRQRTLRRQIHAAGTRDDTRT